jgi:hypothetical protein
VLCSGNSFLELDGCLGKLVVRRRMQGSHCRGEKKEKEEGRKRAPVGPCAATRPSCLVFDLVISAIPMSGEAKMPLLAFQSFSSQLQPTFWHAFTQLKIDVLKLSDVEVPLVGWYGKGKTVLDKETGTEVGLGCTVSFDSSGLEHQR